MSILGNIVLVFLCGAIAALAASIIGCVVKSVQAGDYQITTILPNLISFNAPNYAPNGVGSIFCFLMYFMMGSMIFASTLLSFPCNLIFVILISLQTIALVIWPRLTYQTQTTVTQTTLNLFDPIGAFNFFVSSLGNFTKLLNFSNWKLSYLPFILPYLNMFFSILLCVGALASLIQNLTIATILIAFLQLILARFMINILLDNGLSTVPAN